MANSKYTIEVELEAADFQRAGGRIRLSAEGIAKGTGKAADGVDRTNESLRQLKRTIGGLGLGLLAKQAVGVATAFDDSLTSITTLVGISTDQVQDWRKEIIAIAPEIGRSADEMAKALFVVTSAGERGAGALDLVEQSGKAAAIGMGQTEDIARAATAAVTAFGRENLSSAQALDILVATVRAGNLEASSLAPVLGRVLGVAAELGVGFDEVGAFIATYTKLGLSAAEATTGLAGALRLILKPTPKTRAELGKLKIDVDALRESVAERGLAGTLVELTDTLDGNLDALGQVIPETEALAAVLGVAKRQGESYIQTQHEISNSTGILESGFKTLQESSPGQTFRELQALVETTAISFGAELADALKESIELFEEWAGNAERVQTVAANIGTAVTFLIQTVLWLGENLEIVIALMAAWAAISIYKWMLSVGVAVQNLALDIVILSSANVFNVATWKSLLTLNVAGTLKGWAAAIKLVTTSLVPLVAATAAVTAAIAAPLLLLNERAKEASAAYAQEIDAIVSKTDELVEFLPNVARAIEEAIPVESSPLEEMGSQLDRAQAGLDIWTKKLNQAREDQRRARQAVLEYTEANGHSADTQAFVRQRLEETNAAVGEAFSYFRIYDAAVTRLQGGLTSWATNQGLVGDEIDNTAERIAALQAALEELQRRIDLARTIQDEMDEIQAQIDAIHFDGLAENADRAISQLELVEVAIELGINPLRQLDAETTEWIQNLIMARRELSGINQEIAAGEAILDAGIGRVLEEEVEQVAGTLEDLVGDQLTGWLVDSILGDEVFDAWGRTSEQAGEDLSNALSNALSGSAEDFATAMEEVARATGDGFFRHLGGAVESASALAVEFQDTGLGATSSGISDLLTGIGTMMTSLEEGGAAAMGFGSDLEGVATGALFASQGLVAISSALGFISDEAVQASRQLGGLGRALGQALGGESGGAIGEAAGTLAGAAGMELGRSGETIMGAAATGAQIGMMFGPIGAAWGAAIGAVVGIALDLMHETAQTFADGSTEGGRLSGQVIEGTGELAEQTQDVVDAITGTVNGILDVIGGSFESFSTFGVQIRESSEGIKVWVNGVMQSFGDDVQAAVDYAVTQLFKETQVGGVSATVAGALEAFSGSTVDELQMALQDALTIDNLGIPQIGQELAGKLGELNRLLHRSLEEFGAGAEQLLMGPGGIVATAEDAYNRAFGIEADVEKQTRANIAAVEARIKAEEAHLLATRAQIQAQVAAADVSAKRAEVEVSVSDVIARAADFTGRSMGGLGQVMVATGGAVSGAALASAEALSAIDDALAALQGFDFSAAAIEEAVRRARNASRGGRGGGFESADERGLENFRDRLDDMEEGLEETGVTAAKVGERLSQMRDWIESAAEMGATEEELARARAASVSQLENDLLARAESILAESGLTPFQTQMGEMMASWSDHVGAAFAIAEERLISSGGKLYDHVNPLLETLLQSFAVEGAEVLGNELSGLVEQGDLASIRALQEHFASLYHSMAPGPELDALETVLPDLFTMIADGAADALEVATSNIDERLNETLSVGPHHEDLVAANAEFSGMRTEIMGLIEQAQASGLSVSGLVGRLHQLEAAQSMAGRAIQTDFLSSLEQLGVEVPGLAEAMLTMQVQQAKAQAIALFSNAGAAEQQSQAAVYSAEIVGEATSAMAEQWLYTSGAMLEATGAATAGIVQSVGLMAAGTAEAAAAGAEAVLAAEHAEAMASLEVARHAGAARLDMDVQFAQANQQVAGLSAQGVLDTLVSMGQGMTQVTGLSAQAVTDLMAAMATGMIDVSGLGAEGVVQLLIAMSTGMVDITALGAEGVVDAVAAMAGGMIDVSAVSVQAVGEVLSSLNNVAFDMPLIPGLEMNLGELLQALDDALETGLDALNNGGSSGGGAGVGGVGDIIGGVGDGAGGLSVAEGLLEQLLSMEGGSSAGRSPLQQMHAEMDALIEQFTEIADELPGLGTSLEEVTDRIEALRAARFAELFDQATSSLRDLYDSLTAGSASGLSVQDQLMLAEQEVMELYSAAMAGDLEAAEALAPAIDHLLALGSQMFGTTGGFGDLRADMIAIMEQVFGMGGVDDVIDSLPPIGGGGLSDGVPGGGTTIRPPGAPGFPTSSMPPVIKVTPYDDHQMVAALDEQTEALAVQMDNRERHGEEVLDSFDVLTREVSRVGDALRRANGGARRLGSGPHRRR